ncbi:MAG: 16S rRNA (adenine(1518)-N(6)/adenine(1519)-N(6))-dimethyltransferase RsmA [Anaerolineae bacterium]|nr:16S rRNA (adenine(1518)-N(6)/adenine(1519)-N(6))-dimethyltransferase RsmA [Anaerolineae bacterium]MDQ7034503.1 16S rRNA (adenine(1518)-N(6)/adenine(1519)-N(6))-dimethyltransferase RsmA [Anaerolineae bacterium]
MNPRELLQAFGLNPKKSLGQNFMHDPNTIEKIVVTAEIMPHDTVVEIGAGTGELTARLAQSARHVMAIEVDERLQPLLEERFADTKNVYFIFDDVLKMNVAQLVGAKDFLVVANVPYYITTAILEHVLTPPQRPKRLVITMQYEVAQRICAKPDDMSLLAVSIQYYGKAQIISKLNPAVFWPRPGVNSALLRVDCYERPIVDTPSDALFFRVVKAGFSQKRKQLRNSLSNGLQIKSKAARDYLDAANIDSQRRAETLTLEEWARLSHVVADTGDIEY